GLPRLAAAILSRRARSEFFARRIGSPSFAWLFTRPAVGPGSWGRSGPGRPLPLCRIPDQARERATDLQGEATCQRRQTDRAESAGKVATSGSGAKNSAPGRFPLTWCRRGTRIIVTREGSAQGIR